jgi:hypothetical protein
MSLVAAIVDELKIFDLIGSSRQALSRYWPGTISNLRNSNSRDLTL